jgi:hypothetical protein
VGVAYFAELDTDMTTRGFATEAARRMLRRDPRGRRRVTPLSTAIDAVERGIERRSRRVVAPAWVAGVLPIRTLAQRAIDVGSRPFVEELVRIARSEDAPLTTAQPE